MHSFSFSFVVLFSLLSLSVYANPFPRVNINPLSTSGSLLSALQSTVLDNSDGTARLTIKYQKATDLHYQTNSVIVSLVPIGTSIHTPGQTIRLPRFSRSIGLDTTIITGTYSDLNNVCGNYCEY